MNSRIATATLEDLEHIASWLCEADRFEMALTRDPDDYARLARDALRSDIHMVALIGGLTPAFAFGAYPIGKQTVHVWGFKTAQGVRAIKAVTKYITGVMIPALHDDGIVRATTLVHRDNTPSRRWLAHLGFRPEATPGETGTPLLLYQRDDLERFTAA